MEYVVNFLIGAAVFELYNHFYAKGDKKKVLWGLLIPLFVFLALCLLVVLFK